MHVGDELSAYLDQETTSRSRESIEAHVAECEHCRGELAAVSAASLRLRALSAQEPPAGIFELPADVIPLRRRRVLVGAAAAAALVVAVGLGAGGGSTVPLQLDPLLEQHVARASFDPGFNVLQVQAVAGR